MSLGAIITRVSMDDTDFRKGLNRLKAQAQAIGDLGDRLTVGLSLPIAAFGRFALTAFGEYESLKKALDVVTGSAEATAERIKELRELAKQPGIGFQEAIQGDVRLRAVGISAAQSTKILKQFANAIALSGGGKDELNRVTIQLGQLSAKGKVLAEDLKPIITAAPAVGQALVKMFGTAESESIQKILEAQGKSSREFVDDLLEQLSKLPRVEGGFKNSLENIKDSVFVFGATVGDSANKVFDLSGKLTRLSDRISNAAANFEKLPESQQKAILGTAGFAAALGPMLSILGRVPRIIETVVKAKDGFGRGLKDLNKLVGINFGGGFVSFLQSIGRRIPLIAAGMVALEVVTKNWSNILSGFKNFIQYFADLYREIYAIRVVVDRVVFVFKAVGEVINLVFSTAVNIVENTVRLIVQKFSTVGKVIKSALKGDFDAIGDILAFDAVNTTAQKRFLDQYIKDSKAAFSKIKDDFSSIGQVRPKGVDDAAKKVAKSNTCPDNDIKRAVPSGQSGAVDEITQAINTLNESLRRSDELLKIYGASYDVVNEKIGAYRTLLEDVAGKTGPRVNEAIQLAVEGIKGLQVPVETVNTIQTLDNDLQGIINTALATNNVDIFSQARADMDQAKIKVRSLYDEFADIDYLASAIPGFDALEAKIQAVTKAFRDGTLGADSYQMKLAELQKPAFDAKEGIRSVGAALANLQVQVASPNEVKAAVASLTQEIERQRAILNDQSASEAEQKAAQAQIALLKQQIATEKQKGSVVTQTARAVILAIKESIQAYIAQAVSGLIAKEASTKGIIGLALAGAGIGALFALFDQFVPKLAKGGLAFGPSFALVGDNRNAKHDPELITPLSKLKQYLSDFGGGRTEVFGRLDGNDIRVASAYSASYYSRLN